MSSDAKQTSSPGYARECHQQANRPYSSLAFTASNQSNFASMDVKAAMKDPEFGLHKLGRDHQVKARNGFTPKKVLAIIGGFAALIGCMFGIGVIAAYAERNINSPGQSSAGSGDLSQKTHRIVPRSEKLAEELFALKEMENGEVVTIPYTTLYSVSSEMFTTVTSTVTVEGSTTLTSTEEVCHPTVITKTEKTTELVTITFTTEASPSTPEAEVSPSTSYEHATVTGNPATVTELNTGISYTGALPDVTVSGDPATLTDVQTDTSYTSGLPDITVSGNPATVTNVETDISVTSGYPVITVSGDPATVTDVEPTYSLTTSTISKPGSPQVTIVISDLWGSYASTTVSDIDPVDTTTIWSAATPVIVTVSDLWGTDFSTSSTSTVTITETATDGEPIVVTATVSLTEPLYPPYPTNTSVMTLWPTGTVTSPGNPITSTPVVISGGSKKPQAPGNWGSNGSSNLGCTVMIIAAIMLML